MDYMNKLYYNLRGQTAREKKLDERLAYDTSIFPGLKIKPINQSKVYDLYYIPSMKTIELISTISKDDIILLQLYDRLPSLAQDKFIVDMLSSELHSTNLLEGVRSSKDEIVSTAKEVLEKKSKNKTNLRFFNVINSYAELKLGSLSKPKDAKDIRRIYDEITVDGVEKENLPDGEIFRKKDSYIYRANQEIHRGVSSISGTEEYIKLKIDELLRFINEDKNCNNLIKNAIFHYFFGYIHPFYDGNGRTGRFISSIYLKEDYSWLTALSLSQGSNDSRQDYLKAFHSTNQVSMQGELNFFVDSFLEILNNGQNILRVNLQDKLNLLELAQEKMAEDPNIKDDQDLKDIMEVAIELQLFGSANDFVDINLLREEGVLSYTDQTIRRKLDDLYKMNLLEKISKNPLRYKLNRDYLEN